MDILPLAVARQTLVGFAGYVVPMALMKRGRVTRVLIRSAAAFATFTGGYRLIRLLLKRWISYSRKRPSLLLGPIFEAHLERFSPAIAAGLASLFGNAIDPSYSSSFFVIWLFLRAVRTLPMMPSGRIVAPLTMIASVEVIVPAGFNSPEEMHPSYQNFLESFACGVDLNKMRNPGSKAIGDVVHEYSSDLRFMFQHQYLAIAVKACSVYWPLHALSYLVNRVTGSRSSDVANLAENILRSTAFLTGWVGTMWWAVMAHSRRLVAQNGNGQVLRRHTMVWAWLGGLYVLIEKPGRQVELATYCSAHALNSLYNRYILKQHGEQRAVGTLMLMGACAMLLHSWTKEPNFVKKVLFGEEAKDF